MSPDGSEREIAVQRRRTPVRTLDPRSLAQHVDRLYRSAWALCGSREDAEDLVQETFARVLARRRVLTGGDELYYLMRVLRNTYFTSRRTASRRPVTVAMPDDVEVSDARSPGQPERALEMGEVYAAIASLPDDQRLALVAVDVLGLSYGEAARALHAREATITTRLFRARKQVAKLIEPVEQAHMPTSPADSTGIVTRPAPRQPDRKPGRGNEIASAGVMTDRGTP